MRRFILAASLLPLSAPASAAMDNDAADRTLEALGDPARQEALAKSLGVMAEVMLDLPLAPFLAPLAEAAGEKADAIDPDTTLRSMAPGASDIPRQIEKELPRAMGALAGMGGAIEALLPQLRAMAGQVRDALPNETR